jgi:hypothetical protein
VTRFRGEEHLLNRSAIASRRVAARSGFSPVGPRETPQRANARACRTSRRGRGWAELQPGKTQGLKTSRFRAIRFLGRPPAKRAKPHAASEFKARIEKYPCPIPLLTGVSNLAVAGSARDLHTSESWARISSEAGRVAFLVGKIRLFSRKNKRYSTRRFARRGWPFSSAQVGKVGKISRYKPSFPSGR